MCLCILFSRHFDKIVSRRLSLIFVSCLLKTTAISDLACIWFLSFNVYFSLGMVLNGTNLVPTYVESRECKLNTLYSIAGIYPVFFLNWRFQRSLTAERAYCIKSKFIISSEKPFWIFISLAESKDRACKDIAFESANKCETKGQQILTSSVFSYLQISFRINKLYKQHLSHQLNQWCDCKQRCVRGFRAHA